MRESILNAMSPFGRKSHSRKASGAAVVGGGVRFFSHAQQQQPALYFLFFSISPTHCINDFSLCVVFFVSRSANRKFSAGAGGFQCFRQVWGVYKHLDRAAVAPLYPPFVEHIFTKKEILPCSFFPFALFRLSSVYAITYHTNSVAWPPERVVGLGHTCHKGACVYPCVRAHH